MICRAFPNCSFHREYINRLVPHVTSTEGSALTSNRSLSPSSQSPWTQSTLAQLSAGLSQARQANETPKHPKHPWHLFSSAWRPSFHTPGCAPLYANVRRKLSRPRSIHMDHEKPRRDVSRDFVLESTLPRSVAWCYDLCLSYIAHHTTAQDGIAPCDYQLDSQRGRAYPH